MMGVRGTGEEEVVDFITSSSMTAKRRVFFVFRRGQRIERFSISCQSIFDFQILKNTSNTIVTKWVF